MCDKILALMTLQRNPYLGASLLSNYVSVYFLATPDYIIAHAEVLGGHVLCPALLRLTMSHLRGALQFHQDVVVTDIECWVINGYYSGTTLLNINTTDNYSLKIMT